LNAALDALAAALAGDRERVDAAFADLVGREPALPDHLRAKEG
jgi:hydrogenase expression/formation protein HypC